ncbi:hypothetical protein Emag_002013 [Eimeria magna]
MGPSTAPGLKKLLLLPGDRCLRKCMNLPGTSSINLLWEQLRKTVVQLAVEEENQIAELQARHFSELEEKVQLQLPPGQEGESEAVAPKSKSHSTDAPDLSMSKQVAEWQDRMRSGSRASVFIPSGGQSGEHSKAFLKQLETFASIIAKTQRAERDRQHLIMQEKLKKRTERQVAAGKRKKRNSGAKRKKTIGPRKSIMDIKFARIQAEKQKEQQMRARFKAEKNALDKWHPFFWNIIEEEANNGSYDDYEGAKTIVARGPILRSIERIIASLEEGSFLRTMAANLEMLAQACVSLGTAGGDVVLESERSEIDQSSDASSGEDDGESKLQPAKPAMAQQSEASMGSETSSSVETDSSEEEGSSSEEESDRDVQSSGDESSHEGKPRVSRSSVQQVPETKAAADQTDSKEQYPTLRRQVTRSSSDSSSSGSSSSEPVESADEQKSSSSGESSVDTSESDEDSSSSSESRAAPGDKNVKQRLPPNSPKQESSSSSSSSSSSNGSISSSSSLEFSASLSQPASQQTQKRNPERQQSSSSSSSSRTDEDQGAEQPSRGNSSTNREDETSGSSSSSSSSVSEGTE